MTCFAAFSITVQFTNERVANMTRADSKTVTVTVAIFLLGANMILRLGDDVCRIMQAFNSIINLAVSYRGVSL